MKHLIFTVYDEKAEIFIPPFFVPTLGLATRAFTDCVNSPEHQFGKHPQDYTLFKLGDYDDSTGLFDIPDKRMMGNGVEYRSDETPTPQPEKPNGQDNPPIQPDETG